MSSSLHITQTPNLSYLGQQQAQPYQYGGVGKEPVQPVAYTLVDTTNVSHMLGLMTTVLYSKCIEHPNYQNDCPEIDSISVRLQEMVTSYLEHHATYSRCNLGFEYFLQDFLPTCAKYICIQPQVLMYLGNQFAIVAQQLAHCLQPALTYLTGAGYEVTEIESSIIVPEKKSLFTITGSTDQDFWDKDVMAEGT